MNGFIFPELPYAKDALAPAMSAETIEFHYGKHHQNYVNTLNKLIEGTPFENKPMKAILMHAEGAIFNNAAQVYNHNYFWKCLSPNGGGEPRGNLANALVAKWGSYAEFRAAFTKAALGHFGSGWAWLAKTAVGDLEILTTDNADNPIAHGMKPMLALDLWEHAYYIDYRNNRAAFVEAFFDKLVNWTWIGARYDGAPCGCGMRADGTGCVCLHQVSVKTATGS